MGDVCLALQGSYCSSNRAVGWYSQADINEVKLNSNAGLHDTSFPVIPSVHLWGNMNPVSGNGSTTNDN